MFKEKQTGTKTFSAMFFLDKYHELSFEIFMGSLRAVRLVKFETSGIYFTYKFMLLFVYTTTQKKFCNFHM